MYVATTKHILVSLLLRCWQIHLGWYTVSNNLCSLDSFKHSRLSCVYDPFFISVMFRKEHGIIIWYPMVCFSVNPKYLFWLTASFPSCGLPLHYLNAFSQSPEMMKQQSPNRIAILSHSLIWCYGVVKVMDSIKTQSHDQLSPPCITFQHTVKPVYNDHLYNELYYLWFIQ